MTSVSWASDASSAGYGHDWADIGRQSSNTCSVTTNYRAYQALGSIGLLTTAAPKLTATPFSVNPGNYAFSMQYTLSQASFVVVSVACGGNSGYCQTINSPCTVIVNNAPNPYGSAYIAVCSSQGPGTYSVNGTGPSSLYDWGAIAVYAWPG